MIDLEIEEDLIKLRSILPKPTVTSPRISLDRRVKDEEFRVSPISRFYFAETKLTFSSIFIMIFRMPTMMITALLVSKPASLCVATRVPKRSTPHVLKKASL